MDDLLTIKVTSLQEAVLMLESPPTAGEDRGTLDVTVNHVKLNCPLFWTCHNQGDNVGSIDWPGTWSI